MLHRIIRWALWSPSRLAVTATGGVLGLVLVAAFFAPQSTGAGADREAAAVASASPSRTGAAAAPTVGDEDRVIERMRQDAEQAPVDDLASAPGHDHHHETPLRSGPSGATTGSGVRARRDPAVLFERFVTAWLGGRDAVTPRAWVEDELCRGNTCTPAYERSVRATPLGLIPDAELSALEVESVGDATATAVAELSNGDELRVDAEWDGKGWAVSGLAPA